MIIEETPGEGVWVAYYRDGSSVVPFASEIEALRHALECSMAVGFFKWGETIT